MHCHLNDDQTNSTPLPLFNIGNHGNDYSQIVRLPPASPGSKAGDAAAENLL